MRILKLVAFFLLIVNCSFGQKEDIDEKFTNYYKEPVKHFDSNIKINIKNIASRYNYLKFALNLENISNDFIIYDNSKSKLVLDWGEVILRKTKHYFLKPKQNATEVLDFNGDTRFIRKEAQFIIEGLIKVPSVGALTTIENISVNESDKIIKNDNFEINLVKNEISPKKNNIVISVVNTGENYLIIKPDELQISVSDSKNLSNTTAIKKDILIKPGESKKINLNFNLDDNLDYFEYENKTIIFNSFLSVSTPIKLETITLYFEVDREITYKMNK